METGTNNFFCRCFSLHRGLYIAALKVVTENSDVKDGCNHLEFCYSTISLLSHNDGTIELFHQLSGALVCVWRVTLVLLFWLAAVFPPRGRRFSVSFLVLILWTLPSFEGLLLFWHCLGAFSLHSFGYYLPVFSSLQPAWRAVLSVGTARRLYLCTFSFLISPFTFFH